jgi:hypothetical protein
MPKSRQRCVTSLSSSSKVPGSIHPLARGQLPGIVVALQPVLAAAEFRQTFEFRQLRE